MPESPRTVEAVAAFIENIHIFKGISEDHLFEIAERLDDKRVKAGEVILDMEQPASSFYIIYGGRVDKERQGDGQKHSRLSGGDYFGSDIFFEGKKRSAKLTAQQDGLLLELPGAVFDEIPEAINFLREQLELFMPCRELLDRTHFDWIKENEAVYFAVNKHPILFWRRAPMPILLLLGSIFFLVFGIWYDSIMPMIFSGLGFIIGAIWLAWDFLDWRNDYYIVTNQRVVWLEKIIGFYDSRQEAHLVEVKSIDAKTDAVVQSFFDYGHVNVNTIFGSVDLRYIPYPRQAHVLIEELWQRSKITEQKRAKEQLQQAIVDQIKEARSEAEKKRKPAPKPVEEKPKPTLTERLIANRSQKKKTGLFSLRYEDGKEIIYRKHIVVLFAKTALPALISLVSTGYLFYQLALYLLGRDSLQLSFILLLAVGTIVAWGWLAYRYVDWSNDIFKVSENKIFDIDRKPFGDVQSRSAELVNIESTEYRREGLLSVFFNYGTVYINIGAEEFEFENVLDPGAVQQDINHRYKAVQEKKKLADEKKERDNMLKWLVAFHESGDQVADMIEEISRIKRGDDAESNEEENAQE